jgi:hypothetical protein
VPEFLVETYHSRSDPTGGLPLSAELSRTADELSREGREVTLVRRIDLPDEETCFYLFRAESAEAVLEAATRAGLAFERVVEALADDSTVDEAIRAAPPQRSASPNPQPHEGEQQ